MSVNAIRWAYKQRCGSASAKAVLACLADFASDEGAAWPSLNAIAEQTELSRRSVIRAVGLLEENGFLDVERERTGAVNDRNTYRLNLSKAPSGVVTQCHPPSDRVSPPSDTVSPPVVTDCHPPGDTVAPGVVTQCHPNHHIEPPLNHQEGRAPEDGKRWSETWTVPAEWKQWAISAEGMTPAEADDEAANFRDFWIGVSGNRGVKQNWLATWRNSCRSERSRNARHRARQRTGGPRDGPLNANGLPIRDLTNA